MSEHTTHIVHLLHYFGTGGLENGLVNLINRLPTELFKHTIVCISGSDPVFAQRLDGANVSIININKPSGGGFGYLWGLRKILRGLKPNIIHSRGLAALEAQLASTFMSVRRVHGEHGWDGAEAKLNKKHQLLRKLIAPLITRFVVLSQEGHQFLVDDIGIQPRRIELICNGVDTSKFLPIQRDAGDKVVITTVGRLATVKNQKLLVQAVNELVNVHQRHNIELRIIGDGECHVALSEQIEQLGLQRQCLLLGNRSDIQHQLVFADIFTLPSFAEGISNTILESMACGIPTIASAVGGNIELVADDHSGMLFDSDNLSQLVTALLRYIDNRELRLRHGCRARERVVEKFSLNKMVIHYQQLYLNQLH